MPKFKRGVITGWNGVGSKMIGTMHCSDGSVVFVPRDNWCEPVLDEGGIFVEFGRSAGPRVNGQAWQKPPAPNDFSDGGQINQRPRAKLYVFAQTSRRQPTVAAKWAVVLVAPPKSPSPRRWHQAMRELAHQ